jgi:hypothetical protein
VKKRGGILLALIIFGAIAAWFWGSEWLEIDKCLDGGGRWDDTNKSCQFATGAKI